MAAEVTGEGPSADLLTLDELTPRELQVALVLADGHTIREAAAKLFLSPKTVDYHLRHVYRKLAIGSRDAESLRRSTAATPGITTRMIGVVAEHVRSSSTPWCAQK